MLHTPYPERLAPVSPIPRTIFQTIADSSKVPSEYAENIARLKELNPGWEHRLFGNTEIRDYLQKHLSAPDWELVQSVNPKYMVVLSDLFRYVALYHEGGVYLDIKSTATRPLDEVLLPEHRFVLSQWRNKLGEEYQWAGLYPELVHVPGGEFQQWFVISEPRHPFLAAVIEAVLENIRSYTPTRFGVSKDGVLRVSGPICYTLAIWPLRNYFPWTAVDITDIGFRYSIFEGSPDKDRHQKLQYHYSQCREPIVLKDVYSELPRSCAMTLGEMLSRELLENTDLVLKLAVVSFTPTLAVLFLVGLALIYVS